jgi:hypothetical protein
MPDDFQEWLNRHPEWQEWLTENPAWRSWLIGHHNIWEQALELREQGQTLPQVYANLGLLDQDLAFDREHNQPEHERELKELRASRERQAETITRQAAAYEQLQTQAAHAAKATRTRSNQPWRIDDLPKDLPSELRNKLHAWARQQLQPAQPEQSESRIVKFLRALKPSLG